MKIARTLALAGSFALVGSSSLFAADEAKPADPKAQPKITFDEHIVPIFREHCLSCHNQNEAKSDLALDTYARTMAGGAGGEVVVAGDIDSSRLYALVAHTETPKMPPSQDRIADAKVEMLKKWILGGALENSGSKAKIKPKLDLQLTVTEGNKPSGPPAMPEKFWRQPFVHAVRSGSSTGIASSPWAPLVAVAGQKQIILYNSDTTELLTILAYPEGIPHVLKFSRDGSVLLAGGGRGGASGKVVLFDVKSGKRITEIGDELDAILAADVSNDLSLVALGGPKKMVRVYSVTDGSLVYELKKHTDWITSLEFSPDGTLLASSDRSAGLLIWEAAAGREYQNLTGHTGAVTDVSWRSDSKVLASASEDASIKIWSIDNGKLVKSWPAHRGALCVEFGMNGNLVSGGRDKKAQIWNIEGASLAVSPEQPDMVLEAVLSWDGKRAIVGDWSGACNAIDAKTGKQVGALSANPLPLEQRVGALAQRATELQQAAKTAEEALAAYKAEIAAKKEAEQQAFNKSNFNLSEIKRLEEAKPKLEREVPTKQRQTKEHAAKIKELQAKLTEAKANEKKAADAVAKNPESPNSKQILKIAQERVAKLTGDVTAAEAAAKTLEAELSDATKKLAEATKQLPVARTQVKPLKDALDRAVTARTEAEKLLPEKIAAAQAAVEAAAVGQREAAQAAADKAEFDKLGPQASVAN